MKHEAVTKRYNRAFEVGDQVYLKLQPYIQTLAAPRANHKLAYKYYGPFLIISKINEVAYKLQLPPQATVHLVFHVSLQRRALMPGTPIEARLPHSADDLTIPVAVLQTRWRKKNGGMRERVKIKWSNSDALGVTWEDKASLIARFPHAEAWGQASSQEEGDVTIPAQGSPLASDTGARPVRLKKPNPRVQSPAWAR